jgi:alkylation response protein AidB-like acyl-CoA dehydrogenase
MSDCESLKRSIDNLAPIIREHADASEAQRHQHAAIARALARANLFRVAVPKSLGGLECHPEVQIKVIEEVSRLDGGAGWALMIGIETMGIIGPYFDRATMLETFADPDFITAGALNPLGHATRVDGGYRISGQWPFASGVHNATHFIGQSILHVGDERARDDQGVTLLETLIPAGEFEILDTWHVSGLRGSGSHDVRVDDVFVPDVRVCQMARQTLDETGTLFRIPPYSRLAYNKVGVATGIARAAIDHFVDLAVVKTPRGSVNKLRERPDAHRAVAEAELTLGSARSYALEVVREIWDQVEAGEVPDRKLRARLQLACSGACNASVQAVEKVYAAAGASANFVSNPLERCMRDVLVVRQHIMVSPQWLDGAGRVLLGLESGTFLF